MINSCPQPRERHQRAGVCRHSSDCHCLQQRRPSSPLIAKIRPLLALSLRDVKQNRHTQILAPLRRPWASDLRRERGRRNLTASTRCHSRNVDFRLRGIIDQFCWEKDATPILPNALCKIKHTYPTVTVLVYHIHTIKLSNTRGRCRAWTLGRQCWRTSV